MLLNHGLPFVLLVAHCVSGFILDSFVRLQCMTCKDATSWSDCHEHICSHGDNCHIEVKHHHGHYTIDAGCSGCSHRGSGSHHPGFGKRQSNVVCQTCCDNANNCNVDHCRHLDIGPHATHAGVDHCRQCKREGIRWNCEHTESCGKDEACFMQEFQFLDSAYYHAGCTNEQNCGVVDVESLDPQVLPENVRQGKCCFESACNNITLLHPLQTTTKQTTAPQPQPTTTEAPLLNCIKCHIEGGVGWDCDDIETCKTDQVCFVQELGLTVDVPKVQNIYFHAGCINKSMCADVHHMSVENEHGLSAVNKGNCCLSDECNRLILDNYKAQYLTTTAMTGTTATSTTTTTTTITTTTIPTTTKKEYPNECMQCVNENVGWNCDQTQTCGAGQACFIQKLSMNIHIPTVPDTYYHGGCIAQTECKTIAYKSVNEEHGLADVTEGTCCYKNNCNKNIMETYKAHHTTVAVTTTTPPTTVIVQTTKTTVLKDSTTVTTTTVPVTTKQAETTTSDSTTVTTTLTSKQAETTTTDNLNECMQCVQEGTSWNCDHTETCQVNEFCFIQQMDLTFSIPSTPDRYYHAGCIEQTKCVDISKNSVWNENGLASVTHGACCLGNNCNKNIKDTYEAGNFNSHIIPTEEPSTSTPVVTSASPSTAAKCVVCSEGTCSFLPGIDPVVQCPSDKPFCLNTLDNEADGNQIISKRCATAYECNTKWWQETSDKTVCTTLDSMSTYFNVFSCTFCCTKDKCNDDLFPIKDTLFKGSD